MDAKNSAFLKCMFSLGAASPFIPCINFKRFGQTTYNTPMVTSLWDWWVKAYFKAFSCLPVVHIWLHLCRNSEFEARCVGMRLCGCGYEWNIMWLVIHRITHALQFIFGKQALPLITQGFPWEDFLGLDNCIHWLKSAVCVWTVEP